MLCPEVWNFDPPSYSVSTKSCESDQEIFRTLKHQYFNHHVSLTLPNTMKVPDEFISAILEDSQYYRIDKVPIAEIVKRDFLDFFIHKGRLTALSLNQFSEENSFVLTPYGILIMSLTKCTFQQLGVDSTFTKNSKNSLRKYTLVLDLISDLNDSRKRCEQVQKKFSAHANIKFDIVLAWEPENLNVCPSSIAYYFSKKGYFVKTCNILYKHKLKYNVLVPLCDTDTDIHDLIEWLGAFSLDCDMSTDDYISSMKCPEKNEVFGQVLQLSFTGLIPYSRLEKIIFEINKYIKAKAPLMWISLTIQSFQDCVLSVRNSCLFASEGDQHVTLIFRYDNPTLIYNYNDKKG